MADDDIAETYVLLARAFRVYPTLPRQSHRLCEAWIDHLTDVLMDPEQVCLDGTTTDFLASSTNQPL